MQDGWEARLAWAEQQLHHCQLCPRACGVDRLAGERGWCGTGAEARLFQEFVHLGEEEELVPSHTLYLSGCNLGCRFCHTAEERRQPAPALTPAILAALVERGRNEGARNLNILGGDPMVNLPALLRLFAAAGPLPPVVWNSNFYCSAAALKMAGSLASFWLPDLKCGNSDCAARLLGAADYWEVVRNRLRELYQSMPDRNRIILRHLVLPGHVECCTRPALDWVARELPGIKVSLNLDYLVMPAARGHGSLGRFLAADEKAAATALANELGLRLTRPASLQAFAAYPGAAAPAQSIELVISPSGELFIRHPVRGIMELAAAIQADGHSVTPADPSSRSL